MAALWIVLTTRLTVLRSKQLSVAQGLLESAKDRKLQEDLRSKDIEIGKLQLEADTAKQSIGANKAETAKATQRAAEAQEAAERERLARTKLEAQIAPRRLTPAQELAIAEVCLPFRGKHVNVVSYALDAEAAVLARQIITAFREGRLNVTDSTASIQPVGGFDLGIHVTGSDTALTASIRASLSLIGDLSVAAEDSPERGGGFIMGVGNPNAPADVTVLIGVKPVQK
ncbi:MAG: hypothetical protein WCE63_23215 [Acidobacteriaceae bacterium]